MLIRRPGGPHRLRRPRRRNQQLAGLDVLASVGERLRDVHRPDQVAEQICAAAADLLFAPASGFYVEQHGRHVELGRFGLRSIVPDPSVFQRQLTAAASSDAIVPGPPVLLRVAHATSIVGVLAVTAPGKRLDAIATSALHALAAHAADAFFRVGVRAPIFTYRHDPDTLVFEPSAVPAVLATVQPGDVVVVVRPAVRPHPAGQGITAAQVGAQLSAITRPLHDLIVRTSEDHFIVALRGAAAAVDGVAARLLRQTQLPDGSPGVRIGAATHQPGGSPLDTLHQATRASQAAG